jgi:hypothetical protein
MGPKGIRLRAAIGAETSPGENTLGAGRVTLKEVNG